MCVDAGLVLAMVVGDICIHDAEADDRVGEICCILQVTSDYTRIEGLRPQRSRVIVTSNLPGIEVHYGCWGGQIRK
jgi:hypothetical protein